MSPEKRQAESVRLMMVGALMEDGELEVVQRVMQEIRSIPVVDPQFLRIAVLLCYLEDVE